MQRRLCIKEVARKLSISERIVQQVVDDHFDDHYNVDHDVEYDDVVVGKSPKRVAKPVKTGACVSRSKMKLYDYQLGVVTAMEHSRGVIAVHSVGAGKTLTAVVVAECFLASHPKGKVIVITPKSLVDNFRKEQKAAYGSKNDDRYIFVTKNKFAKDAKNGRMRLPIKDNLVIIDELHNYRTKISPKHVAEFIAKRTKANRKRLPSSYFVYEALRPAAKVLGMTATPFVNDIHDLITIVSIVKGDDIFMKATGVKLLPLLKEHAKGVFSFYERDEHDPRFPSYTIHKIELVMPDDYFEKYIDIERMYSDFAQENFSETFLNNIRSASNMIDNTTHSPKVRWVVNKVVDTVRNGGKSVVYSSYIGSGVEIIKELLEKEGIGVSYISGVVPKDQRTEIVKEYNSGKKPVLLITKAGGEGLDLKKTTNVIMFEPTWTGSSREQIFGRGVRNGSHKDLPESLRHVDCYVLLMVKPRQPKGYNIKKDPRKMYRQPSGDKRIYHFTEAKEKTAQAVMSQLDEISVEGIKIKRWYAKRDESHYLPGEEDPREGVYDTRDVQIIAVAAEEIFKKVTSTPKKRGRPRKTEGEKTAKRKVGRPKKTKRKKSTLGGFIVKE